MTTNVITVDSEKISNAIINFRIIYDKYPKYIIMNENTEKLLIKQNVENVFNYIPPKSKTGTYEGISVAIYNSLEDGEIDLV